jgi:hypothetical protein
LELVYGPLWGLFNADPGRYWQKGSDVTIFSSRDAVSFFGYFKPYIVIWVGDVVKVCCPGDAIRVWWSDDVFNNCCLGITVDCLVNFVARGGFKMADPSELF